MNYDTPFLLLTIVKDDSTIIIKAKPHKATVKTNLIMLLSNWKSRLAFCVVSFNQVHPKLELAEIIQ